MSFAQKAAVVSSCPGLLAAAIADREGIPVESWGQEAAEVEETVAEYSTFLRDIATANRELDIGELEQVVVVGSRRTVVVTSITRDYFLLVVVERTGNTGKARFVSRVAAFRLRNEFL